MAEVQKVIDWHYEHESQLDSHKLDMGLINATTFPGKNELIAALNSKDIRKVIDERNKFGDWMRSQIGKPGFSFDAAHNVWQHISDEINILNRTPNKEDDFEQRYMVEVEKLIAQSQANMESIKSSIENAISGIPSWSGSPITLQAQENSDVEIEPATNALVRVGSGRMAPYFSLFTHEGKILIDDVLEGGDTDFFDDSETQSDYFALINELRNPGSANRRGRILTLYTARPASDRRTFENATTVPGNLFLTKSYDFAVGHGADYNVKKDVWKVRIDSRYLTQTFDGPGQEQYQITGGKEVPIQSITLIDAAE